MAEQSIVRYSDEELQEFKELIDKKLEKAYRELEFMREQILELNENTSDHQGGNWFDDSSLHLELEMLNNSVMRQQQFVRNLENALIRIQNKTYGICTVTGELIEKKRLMLVPHATKSVAAKDMINTNDLSISTQGAGPSSGSSFEDEDSESDEPKKPVKRERKVITKIKKKPNPANPPTKKIDVNLDDDDDDWADIDDEDDFNEDLNNIDFDSIADED